MNNQQSPLSAMPGVAYYFTQLRKHWVLTLLVALAAVAALFSYYASQEERYSAQSELLLELNPAQVAQFEAVVDLRIERGLVDAAMNTHRERMQSSQTANQILRESFDQAELKTIFAHFPDARGSKGEILLNSILEIIWVPDSQIIEVTATHPDPEVSAELANAYAHGYIESLVSLLSEGNESAVDFLDKQANQLSSEIESTLDAQREFREKNNLISVPKERELAERRIEKLESAMTDQRVERLKLETTESAIEESDLNAESLESIPEIFADTRVAKLAESLADARTERSVLSKTLLERHPSMEANEARIASLEQSLEESLNKARSKIENQLAKIRQSEIQLREELATEVARIRELDRLAAQGESLSRELAAKRLTGEQIAKRLNEANVSSRLKMSNVRVLTNAEVPTRSSYPNKLAVAASGLLLFGAIVLAIPMLSEAGRTKLRTFAEIEYYLDRPVIGHVQQSAAGRKKTTTAQREDAAFTESFRNLIAQLTISSTQPLGGVYLITSTDAGEGKSLVASNLARSLAEHGQKTLLIDCDLRRPRLHQSVELENDHGLITWAEASGDPDDLSSAQIKEAAPKLGLLRSGGSTTTPTEFLQDPAFSGLLERLKSRFDAIVIDSPPVGPCPDAVLLAAHADQTIFVVRQGRVLRRKVKAAVARLEKTASPVTGIVLNGIHGKSADETYGMYHSQYGVGYGYSKNYYAADKNAKAMKIRHVQKKPKKAPQPEESDHRRNGTGPKKRPVERV